ncbi:MAG: glycoside hydrolase family 2 TIM barrel-domain containing protein [Bacteroidota bacterium]|nr:glycoside hydrolase family 2 TIM barrel-domain containing protein [Bacteroidota bacterium]
MQKKPALSLLIILLTVSLHAQVQDSRKIIVFDNDWKFFKGDMTGAEASGFNDATWRSLNVPHDWSIEGPYDRNNTTGRGGGYLPGGIGWYRKTFSLSPADANNNIYIEFDGVMANSDVWINGFHLGKRPNGYVSFQYELTGHLNFGDGQKNIIAVRADNSVQPASRWYTGAGIYRHVRLISANPVHVAHWGSFVSCTNVTGRNAIVQVQTVVDNASPSEQKITLQVNIIAPGGKQVASVQSEKKIAANSHETIVQKIKIEEPALWDIETPQLYKAITKIIINKKQADELTTSFGIRDARFEAATGFWLNGKNIKIKGVCLHHDGGAVGAAVPLRVWEKRLQSLKDAGVNGIRTSHNEAAPEFLDLCDKMGFLVMDETFDTWNARKSNAENGYNLYFTDWWEKDTRDIVLRDRNHPSIVIYSIGNEIHDNLNDSSGFRKYKMQQDLVHSLDTTRPVTMALFRPALSHVYENGLANKMDVVGQNYRENELIAAHESNPQRKVIGTENRHELAAWLALRDKPFMAGQFLWTGYDYLGESDWPGVAHGSGLFDKTGAERIIGYQQQSWWSDKPMVYVMRKEGNAGAGDWISDWSPTDIDTYDEARIQVFSNCDEVELFLNGKSAGAKTRPEDNASPRTWTITFQKGTLKAVARNKGKVVAEQELKTAGKPSKIILTADKPGVENNWNDVVYVTATVTDDEGNPVLSADSKITFGITGPGFIAAVDNSDLASVEPFSSKERWAYKGRCIAIIKANGDAGSIHITANAENLKEGSASIEVKNEKNYQ